MEHAHFIMISSSYVEGKRIAFHLSSAGEISAGLIDVFINRYEKELNHINIGVHLLTTKSATWKSVVESDSFFADILCMQKFEDFIEIEKQDEYVSALDIAKYIASATKVTHLKLQKLIYFVYEEFLRKYEKPLFKEKIIAYQYGPVVEEVYQSFKSYGRDEIKDIYDDSYVISDREDVLGISSAAAMKIAASPMNKEILEILCRAIVKYKDHTANDMVNLTHETNSPWSKVYKSHENREITDEVIKSYY